MSFHPFQALEHGGPDALGVPRWDFSANANACGVAPHAWTLIAEADRAHYPDPTYADLRAALGAQHGVAPERIVLAASGSEFVRRISVAVALGRPDDACVRVPAQAYAEYAAAARALGLRCDTQAAGALPLLAWWASPDSPTGVAVEVPRDPVATHGVVDLAYAPLQLEGAPCEPPAWTWQLWSPNKALGLTGVRGAYAVAPEAAMRRGHPDAVLLDRLQALAPSWPLGAEGVALLSAWARPETGAWLVHSRATLRAWKARQVAMLEALGWVLEPGVANFMRASWRLDGDDAPQRRQALLQGLREEGVKLRDTGSLGVEGGLRLSVQPPAAQDALAEAWLRVRLTLARQAAASADPVPVAEAPAADVHERAAGSAPAPELAPQGQTELPFSAPAIERPADTGPQEAPAASSPDGTQAPPSADAPAVSARKNTRRGGRGRSRPSEPAPGGPEAVARPTARDAVAPAEAAAAPATEPAAEPAARPAAKPAPRPRAPARKRGARPAEAVEVVEVTALGAAAAPAPEKSPRAAPRTASRKKAAAPAPTPAAVDPQQADAAAPAEATAPPSSPRARKTGAAPRGEKAGRVPATKTPVKDAEPARAEADAPAAPRPATKQRRKPAAVDE